MDQTNRQMHQPSSNELRSLNDNLDENIQRNQQDMPLDDADATPVIAANKDSILLAMPTENGNKLEMSRLQNAKQL